MTRSSLAPIVGLLASSFACITIACGGGDASNGPDGGDAGADGSNTGSDAGRGDAGGDAGSDGGDAGVDAGLLVHFFDISNPGQGANSDIIALSSRFQSSVIDADNSRILTLGWSKAAIGLNQYLELNCRNFDGTACAGGGYAQLSNDTFSGFEPSAVIDTKSATHRLLVLSDDDSGLLLTRCSLDASITSSSCSAALVSDAASAQVTTGIAPSAAIDATGTGALVVAYGAAGNALTLARCALDGTGCNMGSGLGGTAHEPALALDTTLNKAVVAYSDANDNLALAACDLGAGLTLTGCVTQGIGTTTGSNHGLWPAIAYDATSQTLFVAGEDDTANQPASFLRCVSSGNASAPYTCTAVDLSSLPGAGTGSGWTPSLAVANGKVLLVTMNVSKGYFPWLFRCNIDGTGCDSRDWSGVNHPVNDSGYFPVALPHAGSLHVVSSWLNQQNPRFYVPVLESGLL